jgi:hypothetical protein
MKRNNFRTVRLYACHRYTAFVPTTPKTSIRFFGKERYYSICIWQGRCNWQGFCRDSGGSDDPQHGYSDKDEIQVNASTSILSI